MISSSAKKITYFFVASNIIKKDEEEIYSYGLELILSSLMNVFAALFISLVFQRFFEGISFLLFFITLRTYAGGVHASNYLSCFLSFIIIFSLAIILSIVIPQSFYMIIVAICLIFINSVILSLAPMQDKNKPLTQTQILRYRKTSILIVLSQALFIVIGFALKIGIEKYLFCAMLGSLSVASLVLAAKINERSVKK